MTTYVFDSSALVKRYVSEQGSKWVRDIVRPSADHVVFAAQLTPVELLSALTRRKNRGEISPRTMRAAHLLLNRHFVREYQIIPMSDAIIEQAKLLVEKHELRAADAIQLASALRIHLRLLENMLSSLVFVAADERLLKTAAAEGILTDNPILHETT